MVSGTRMAVDGEKTVEVEVFGVTYERYALAKLFARFVRKLQLRSVIEIPASGAKAMPSLYSLGFALAGSQVTLVDADPTGLEVWRELGLNNRLNAVSADQVEDALREGSRWDLCWNFAVLPSADMPREMLNRMIRLSFRYILFIHVNRFNIGFFMHRSVHRLWKVPWTHGDLRLFSPFQMARFMKKSGVKNIRWGVVDCPPWPDSPGVRDLRLHRLGERLVNWQSPYAHYLRSGNFPGWMKLVYAGERLPIPAWMKLPYAHLFYVIGQVDHENGR